MAIGDENENYYCDVQSATTTVITCITRPIGNPSIHKDTATKLFMKIKLAEDAVCTGDCSFTYNSALDM